MTGLFVVPLEAIERGKCFDAYSIAHNRESEGYVEVWYDQINASEEEHWYEFQPLSNDSDLYMTVETYSYNIVPEVCTSESVGGYFGTSPFAYFDVYYGGENPYSYFWDYAHSPLHIKEGEYRAGQTFDIMVKYEWYGSPARDFTVKIYSKHNETQLTDSAGYANMLYTDGREPSEFSQTKINVLDAINSFDDYFYFRLSNETKEHIDSEAVPLVQQCENSWDCGRDRDYCCNTINLGQVPVTGEGSTFDFSRCMK